jgi:dephospho-CoA kinase
MPSNSPRLVGVTGGIGSGKSTVCGILADFGRKVISADEVARDLTEHDPGIRDAITRTFGPEMYDAAGLRRKALAAIVFSDPSRKADLDRIVHPRVFDRITDTITGLPPASSQPYIVIEAALVFETGMDEWLNATILVRASDKNRISRIVARDGLSEEEVRLRFRAQNAVEKNSDRADYIIDNDGSAGSLIEKVRFIDRLLGLTLGRQ